MYEKYFQEYNNEIHKILSSYLFWKMINNRPEPNSKLLRALNTTPISWILIRNSLQVNLFITLGRIFDTHKGAFSIDDLLKCCIKEINIFSLENLKNRKLDGISGEEPEWLSEYINNSHEATIKDFNKLRGEISKHRKTFENIYRPIRHKIIAHTDKEYMGKTDELWAETNIGELEKIIWFLYDLQETLFDVFHNGKKADLKGRKPDIDFYERDFSKLLDNIEKA